MYCNHGTSEHAITEEWAFRRKRRDELISKLDWTDICIIAGEYIHRVNRNYITSVLENDPRYTGITVTDAEIDRMAELVSDFMESNHSDVMWQVEFEAIDEVLNSRK